MTRLKSKIALITGGAGGMGASHVKRFVAEGAKVYFTDLSEEAGANLQKELGEQAVFLKQDVTSEDDWKAVVETIAKAEGKLDVLVNNAGITGTQGVIGELTAIGELTLQDFQKVLDVNIVSVFLGLTYSLPLLKKSGNASVINISSIAGQKGMYGGVAYSGSKFAVRGITQVAALELGQFNIRANAVYPGVIQTPILGAVDDEFLDKITEKQSVKRLGQSDDITNVVVFLASDEASFATGGDFVVDGGYLLA